MGCKTKMLDIPEYLERCRKGLYGPSLRLNSVKNALPFITGTICAHRCQGKCSRNFYEESVHIRETKLLAAEKGYSALMASLRIPEPVDDKKVAIVGGGPTGIAAAYFLGREGVPTTIFERERKLGGVPRYVIPAFRISDEAIDKDIALMERYGVEVKLGKPAPSVEQLKTMGYTHILMATGAWTPRALQSAWVRMRPSSTAARRSSCPPTSTSSSSPSTRASNSSSWPRPSSRAAASC